MADDAVGEDSKVLYRFAKIDNYAFSGRQIRGSKNWDVRFCESGVQWKTRGNEAGSFKSCRDFTADASYAKLKVLCRQKNDDLREAHYPLPHVASRGRVHSC